MRAIVKPDVQNKSYPVKITTGSKQLTTVSLVQLKFRTKNFFHENKIVLDLQEVLI